MQAKGRAGPGGLWPYPSVQLKGRLQTSWNELSGGGPNLISEHGAAGNSIDDFRDHNRLGNDK